jgi:glutathione synthase/RimK-type ligase-like ATP-grasp enzyme
VIDFLGIARERVYSPGKVDDDRAILDAVAAHLAATHRVQVISADAALPATAPAAVVFAMCQGPAALDALRRWEADGVRVINAVAGIANAHRRRMLAAFARHGVPHPQSAILATDDGAGLPAWVDDGAWLKRGDVHATDADDVARVADRGAARAGLAAFAQRSIATACVQRHVDGEVIKFYAVRGRGFFACFGADGAAPQLDRTTEGALQDLAEAGAAALQLEVFGGDCVRDRDNRLWLIDLNDWPSYGPCRFEASEAIASYVRQASKP